MFGKKEQETAQKRNGLPGRKIRWMIVGYDLIIIVAVCAVAMLSGFFGASRMALGSAAIHTLAAALFTMAGRTVMGIYYRVWRYGGVKNYMSLLVADGIGLALYLSFSAVDGFLPSTSRFRIAAIMLTIMLSTLMFRLVYQYMYQYSNTHEDRFSKAIDQLMFILTGTRRRAKERNTTQKIKVAIMGAGYVGAMLSEELLNNPQTNYQPVCFIEVSPEKIGRSLEGLPIFSEEASRNGALAKLGVQEVVIALPFATAEEKFERYKAYKDLGFKIKTYDYPTMQQPMQDGRRMLREFDIEELLFRQVVDFSDQKTRDWYQGKVVMITGGGGSIGSELCRQVAALNAEKIIIVDICENGAYDVQQELKIKYHKEDYPAVEICSVCDKRGMETLFERYHPQVVLHAAAHKHVPLMEHNCVEAVKNNVFGTLNVVECCEKYGVIKAVMVSTDKAVNPTNVMGATKRMCEMIFQSRVDSKTSFSCTRFGNVLGSSGSVIPLFKRQIANGGPVTLTDFRIIRYFMTIPEASQLVLNSGAMAKHGDLFVLDMGKPIKILELAENMIRLSGYEPYKDINIIETGLRPGEKLYEELLIKSEELDKTENSMIFIERDTPLSRQVIEEKLAVLHEAVDTADDDVVREAMKQVVPTFHAPEVVNAKAEEAAEMKRAKKYQAPALASTRT